MRPVVNRNWQSHHRDTHGSDGSRKERFAGERDSLARTGRDDARKTTVNDAIVRVPCIATAADNVLSDASCISQTESPARGIWGEYVCCKSDSLPQQGLGYAHTQAAFTQTGEKGDKTSERPWTERLAAWTTRNLTSCYCEGRRFVIAKDIGLLLQRMTACYCKGWLLVMAKDDKLLLRRMTNCYCKRWQTVTAKDDKLLLQRMTNC